MRWAHNQDENGGLGQAHSGVLRKDRPEQS
jgi:hypothetical protein